MTHRKTLLLAFLCTTLLLRPHASASSQGMIPPAYAEAAPEAMQGRDPWPETAWNQQLSYDELSIESIPQVTNFFTVHQMFLRARDARDWRWDSMDDLPRRLTWLYPADGCFMRAEFMVQKFRDWGFTVPMQIFAFGDLSFKTLHGQVNWWYHVAPVVRVGREVFVIDPAMDYYVPLPLKTWIERLSIAPDHAAFALCNAGAVTPDDDCSATESVWDPTDRAATLQQYLAEEWNELERILGHSPHSLLTDAPPWKRPIIQPGATPF